MKARAVVYISGCAAAAELRATAADSCPSLAGGAAAAAAGQAAPGDGRHGRRRQLPVPQRRQRPVGLAALPRQRAPQGGEVDAVRARPRAWCCRGSGVHCGAMPVLLMRSAGGRLTMSGRHRRVSRVPAKACHKSRILLVSLGGLCSLAALHLGWTGLRVASMAACVQGACR